MNGSRRKIRVGAGIFVLAVSALLGGGFLLGPALGQDTSTSTDDSTTEPARSAANGRPTEIVTRGDLTEKKESAGSVSYGDSWVAPFEATGVVTRSHPKGTVVQPGEPLIWLGTQPIYLAAGEVPVYRELFYGRDADKKLQSGDDVRQLQEFLLAQGFDDGERLTADGEFGPTTQRAVKAWQKENGLQTTGRVDRTQLVFHPTAVRIDNEPMVGAQFTELLVSNVEQTITASFDDRSRSFLPVGGTVELAVGDEPLSTGTIDSVDSAVQDDGSRGFSVKITPDQPIDSEIERVTVTARKVVADNVLLVPARSILALAGSGYAVEVRTEAGPELRRIELGEFVDDMVEITGDITEGDEVIVPDDGIGGGA